MDNRIIWKTPDTGGNLDIIYLAYKQDLVLGFLRYEKVGDFMHWCWYQYKDIGMSPGLLQEVRNKQKDLINMKRDKHDISWM